MNVNGCEQYSQLVTEASGFHTGGINNRVGVALIMDDDCSTILIAEPRIGIIPCEDPVSVN